MNAGQQNQMKAGEGELGEKHHLCEVTASPTGDIYAGIWLKWDHVLV